MIANIDLSPGNVVWINGAVRAEVKSVSPDTGTANVQTDRWPESITVPIRCLSAEKSTRKPE